MIFRINKLLYFSLIIVTSIAKAQPYYFRHYQVENGLSNNTVYCSVQDNKGFLWFGTKDGINRFDGINFKIFHIHNDNAEKLIGANYINCLFNDKQGGLWVGSKRGLYKYNEDKERFEPIIDSLRDIYEIQMDKIGQIWFLSGNTVCRYNFKNKILKQFSPAEYFYGTSICILKDGNIWASTMQGFLEKFNDATGKFTAVDVFSHSIAPTSR